MGTYTLQEGKKVKIQIDKRYVEDMVLFELKEEYALFIKPVENRSAIAEWAFPVSAIKFKNDTLILERIHGTLEIYESPKSGAFGSKLAYESRQDLLKKVGLI